MYQNKGVGLAANQVGIDKMIAVVNPSGEKEDELVLINPEIIEARGSASLEEGCLSCPGINAQITRAQHIEVRFQDERGASCVVEAEGIFARIIQHEVDHLRGKAIIDRMSPAARIFHNSQIKTLKNKVMKGK